MSLKKLRAKTFGAHNFGVWQRVVDGTCTRRAEFKRFCSIGNCTEFEEKTGDYAHPAGAVSEYINKEPTCLEDGEKTIECTNCGNKYTEIIKSAGEHNMQVVPDKDTPGTHYRACSVCGTKDTETGNKPCQYKRTNVTPLPKSCTDTVTKEYTCAVCGDSYTEEGNFLEAHSTDHSGGINYIKKPTCIEPGSLSFYCGRELLEGVTCMYEYDVQELEINLDAHNEQWIPVSGESKDQCICTICEQILMTQDCIRNPEPTKHYPTCISDGYEIYHCQICNRTIGEPDFSTNMGKALGHDYQEDNTCSRCSHRREEVQSITYEISETYVSNVKVNTSVKDAKSQITTDADDVKIYKSDDTIAGEEDIMATGMRLESTAGDRTSSLAIVVKGDTTGDGNADFADMVLSNKERLGKTTLENEFFKAADVNNDGENDILDLVKINKFRLSKIVEL